MRPTDRARVRLCARVLDRRGGFFVGRALRFEGVRRRSTVLLCQGSLVALSGGGEGMVPVKAHY